MRSRADVEVLVAVLLAAFVCVAAILLETGSGWAMPADGGAAPSLKSNSAPILLTADDRIATLENVHFALATLGDGSSYVWHRHHGRLSGVAQPTQSFIDRRGRVCRHLVLILNAGGKSGRTETIACRIDGGRWRLDS